MKLKIIYVCKYFFELMEINDELKESSIDLRIEPLIVELANNGFETDKIMIHSLGSSFRSVSKDIQTVVEKENIIIKVNREGIYDYLPEGIFHENILDNDEAVNKDAIVNKIKVNRQDEAEARNFFLPIETEFYYSKILIEEEERKINLGYLNRTNQELFYTFWKIIKDFDKKQLNILLHLLPLAYYIKGDMELIEYCFKKVLSVPVKLVFEKGKPEDTHIPTVSIGETELGINMVLGNTIFDDELIINMHIGPVDVKLLPSFFQNGQYDRIINFLINYFIPADLVIKKKISTYNIENKIYINNSSQICYLGFNSYI